MRVEGFQDQWFRVYYGGGREGRAGEGWVDQDEVTPTGAPKWVATRWESPVRTGLGRGEGSGDRLPVGAVLELLEDRGNDLRVFYLGDGRSDPVEGWVKVPDLGAAGTMLSAEGRGLRLLSRSEVAALRAGDGKWMKVPFRTQLDGSAAASANCGPASVGMVLGFFQKPVPTEELRSVANRLQGTYGPDAGFGIEYLDALAEQFGLKSQDLYAAGRAFKRWDLEGLRAHLARGHLVIPELRFRLMPGRSGSDSWDDHYVVITGMQGDDFIYNDSVDSDGPGYGRVMNSEALLRAW